MLLLNQGQRPLLDFLRNLTPQALLATTSLVIGKTLDLRHFDLSNWFLTVSYFLCIGFALLAFIANMNQFMDALLATLTDVSRRARRLRRAGFSRWRAALLTLRATFKQRPTLAIDFVLTVALVNVAWVVIAIAALSSARAALR